MPTSEMEPHFAPPPARQPAGTRWHLCRRWWAAAGAAVVAAMASAAGYAWYWQQPAQRFALALEAVRNGQFEAVRRYAEALGKAPGFEAQSHFLRGVLLLESGKPWAALAEFGHAVDHPDLRVATLTLSGRALYESRRWADAARLLRQAVEADPAAVEAHRFLALSYYALGMNREATVHLLRVAELAPDDPRPHRLLGSMYKDFQEYASAVENYQEALRRTGRPLPDRETMLLELAECQLQLQQPEAAMETLAAVPPGPDRFALEAEALRQEGQLDEAERLADQALRQRPALLAALLLKGDVCLARGDARTAAEILTRAQIAYPKNHHVVAKLMQAFRRLGDEARVRELAGQAEHLKKLWTEFSELHAQAADQPDNADVRCRLGMLARELDRPDLARSWFEAALAIQPNHAEALRQLALGSGSGDSSLPAPAASSPPSAEQPVESSKPVQLSSAGPKAAAGSIRFQDVTAQTGIAFVHTDGSSGKRYIAETVSTGLATFDYDGDGLVDIYFPNGAPLPPLPADAKPRHALYRNLGAWRFEEVTRQAGVLCAGYGLGAVIADYDNNGTADLYVSNFGPKVLWRNRGDGTFAEVSEDAGVADGDRLGAGCAFLDADGDGNLDLFAGNYVKFTYQTHVVLSKAGFPEYAGPRQYPPDRQTLFHSQGDGTFRDASETSGIAQYAGKGMGVVCADYDRDGDTDIFLLNDVFGNHCFRNDGKGHFDEVALLNGFKYSGEGMPLGSMGVDCGDYDNDGWLDFFQTSYQGELPVLFRNLGGGLLEDVTVRAGAGQGSLHNVKWGCGLVDFDNDGRRDLFVALGHLQDLIDQYDRTTSYKARNVLLLNTGGGRFVDISAAAGLADLAPHSARGACFEDFDEDGDIDVVILNSREAPTLLRNLYYEQGGTNHYLRIALRGTNTNRDGVGARVEVTAGDLVLVDEVHSGRGYQSHWGSWLHFGLGTHDRVDRIQVHWLGGQREVFPGSPADRLITLVEGSGMQPARTKDDSRKDERDIRIGEGRMRKDQ